MPNCGIALEINLFYLVLILTFSSQQDVAAFIKREFDKKYNPTWYAAPHLSLSLGELVYSEN